MSYALAYGIRIAGALGLRWSVMTKGEGPLPRVLEILWRDPQPVRRGQGLSRERIVTAAVELADADGLDALSMARLAERLGCGTMSLYRHVANKDELVTFMLSTAPGPPPVTDPADWRGALADWAAGLWEVYHRHPWILQAAAGGPPADPGQLAWLDAGLAALGGTGLAEQDKLAAVMAVLHFVRGAAALDIEASGVASPDYPALLRRVMDPSRFPALAAALEKGVFDRAEDDPQAEFRSGLGQLLDGIAAKMT
jgi:AcrR family transcriptional regulator